MSVNEFRKQRIIVQPEKFVVKGPGGETYQLEPARLSDRKVINFLKAVYEPGKLSGSVTIEGDKRVELYRWFGDEVIYSARNFPDTPWQGLRHLEVPGAQVTRL